MPGLLDIAASRRTVAVGDVLVPISGISAAGLAYILESYPDARKALSGQAVDMSFQDVVALAPDALADIIVLGTGNDSLSADYPAALAAAKALPMEAQFDLCEAIADVTMPKGVAPFVERLGRIADALTEKLTSTADTKSPKVLKS